MRSPASTLMVLLAILAFHQGASADAIVMTRAMRASTILEAFVEESVVRLEVEVGAADLHRARLSRVDQCADVSDPEPGRIGHPITLGTLNSPASDSGALASASSFAIDPPTRSSRRLR